MVLGHAEAKVSKRDAMEVGFRTVALASSLYSLSLVTWSYAPSMESWWWDSSGRHWLNLDVLLSGTALALLSFVFWLASPGLAARVATHHGEPGESVDSGDVKGAVFACAGLIVILIGVNGIIEFVSEQVYETRR